ncbi:hypothetical protein BK120_30370 [Paenibacillus sp. FSL A5-0031]|uniref:hypothetical protein n=1 Tax=Paenibacillus sp. FSL A5-0031 TaxID=1920420 RepID=UPI00096F3574|nr:hypothetical protein [Paenibacillus sp. FSL A5-0031]OME75970.1 hypothetical protein BK120_30370 [Paenibacillus sp. FSL A5-0031]
MKRTKNLFVVFVTIISILSFSLTASATPQPSLNVASFDKQLVKVVTYPEEKNIDKLVQLALKQKKVSPSKNSDSLQARQLLQEKTFSDGYTEKYYALSSIPGSQSKSNGKYDIGAVVTMYYTIYGTAPYYSDAKTKVDRVTATINDAGQDPKYVSKIEMFYHGFLNPQTPQVDRYSTINNPSSGSVYTLFANDSTLYYTSGFASVNGGAVLTFSDDTKLGTNNELTIVLY